jgi:hypothetical protein
LTQPSIRKLPFLSVGTVALHSTCGDSCHCTRAPLREPNLALSAPNLKHMTCKRSRIHALRCAMDALVTHFTGTFQRYLLTRALLLRRESRDFGPFLRKSRRLAQKLLGSPGLYQRVPRGLPELRWMERSGTPSCPKRGVGEWFHVRTTSSGCMS